MTNPTVALETNHGRIVLELDAGKAPKTVENFLQYVNAGFYDGTLFHRVIPNFMIQGGGFNAQQKQKPTQGSVQNEADNGLLNGRGTVAMARTSDPHSATAQFFINLKDNGFLNHSGKTAQGWGYTVFGKVIEGMDVVDKIARTPTSQGSISEAVPKEPALIEKATALPAAS
ncbi:MAG TPA: peptidylprolyl isomerase [Thermoanaerobaculia bacterium]|nr:peptidylprolyl isomerase [Thermoanaerobaculia bacterium]